MPPRPVSATCDVEFFDHNPLDVPFGLKLTRLDSHPLLHAMAAQLGVSVVF